MAIDRCFKSEQCPFCENLSAEEKTEAIYPDIHEGDPHMTCAGPSAFPEEKVNGIYPFAYERELFVLYAGPPV